METITISGASFTIDTRLKNVRNASARLIGSTIRMTLPSHIDEKSRQEVYEKLKSKIIKRIEKIGSARLDSSAIEIKDGSQINAMGRTFAISIRRCDNRRYSSARVIGNSIEIKLANGAANGPESAIASKLVVKALSKAMQNSINERVMALNEAYFKAQLSKIRIRNNSTLWGSYSTKSRSISLNFKLLFAPEEVLDYVIVHELAHSRVHNHGREFWSLVAEAMPDYMEKRKWLRKNGSSLGIKTLL